MNFLKNIFRMAMVAFAAIAFVACDNGDLEGVNKNLTLSVDVDNITATTAKIKVTHNGKTADSWYYVLTTDLSAKEDAVISEAVETLKKQDIGSHLIFNKNYTEILTNLLPKTTYKFIAFGLSEEGKVYGDRASVKFTTLAKSEGGEGGDDVVDEVYDTMIVNPSWSIAYAGAGTINGESYDHIVSVNSSDNNPYVITVVYASEYNSSLLPLLGEQLLESMYEYLDDLNSSYGTSYVLNDMLRRSSSSEAFDDLYPGYYVAIAFGITAKGEVSGLYAVSKTFHIEEEAPTSLYSAWIGDWVLTGDNNVSNDIIIARNIANKSITLYGLQGLPFAVVGEYSTDRNDIIFYAQTVYPNYEFSDGNIANIVLVGVDRDLKTYSPAEYGNYGIAIAGVMESESTGSQRTIVRYGVNDITYPKFVAMMLVAEKGGEFYTLGTESMEKLPSFNAAAFISEPTSTTNSVSPLRFSLGKTQLPTVAPQLRLGKEIETVRF